MAARVHCTQDKDTQLCGRWNLLTPLYHHTYVTNKDVLRFYLFHSRRLGGGNKLVS